MFYPFESTVYYCPVSPIPMYVPFLPPNDGLRYPTSIHFSLCYNRGGGGYHPQPCSSATPPGKLHITLRGDTDSGPCPLNLPPPFDRPQTHPSGSGCAAHSSTLPSPAITVRPIIARPGREAAYDMPSASRTAPPPSHPPILLGPTIFRALTRTARFLP